MLQSPTGGSILSSKRGKPESKKLNPDIKGHLHGPLQQLLHGAGEESASTPWLPPWSPLDLCHSSSAVTSTALFLSRRSAMSWACDLSSAARLRPVELSRQHCGSGEAQLCQGHKQDSVFCMVPTRREFLLFTNISPCVRTSLVSSRAPPPAFQYGWVAHRRWVCRACLLAGPVL